MTSALAASADADFVRHATFTRRAPAVLIDSAIVGFSIGAVVVLAGATGRPSSFPRALARFVAKVPLGIVSRVRVKNVASGSRGPG